MYTQKKKNLIRHVHNLTLRTRALCFLFFFLSSFIMRSSLLSLCPLLPREGERLRAEGREEGGCEGERVREEAVLDNTIPQIYSIPSVPQVSLY